MQRVIHCCLFILFLCTPSLAFVIPAGTSGTVHASGTPGFTGGPYCAITSSTSTIFNPPGWSVSFVSSSAVSISVPLNAVPGSYYCENYGPSGNITSDAFTVSVPVPPPSGVSTPCVSAAPGTYGLGFDGGATPCDYLAASVIHKNDLAPILKAVLGLCLAMLAVWQGPRLVKMLVSHFSDLRGNTHSPDEHASEHGAAGGSSGGSDADQCRETSVTHDEEPEPAYSWDQLRGRL